MKTAVSHPYDRSALLTLKNPAYVKDLERFVMGAYESDTNEGDATEVLMETSWDGPKDCRAVVSSKCGGVFCGEMEMLWFLQTVAPRIKCEFWVHDGEFFKLSTPLFRLTGNAQLIFAIERTLLNTIQRLSGVATITAEFVKKASPCPVAATRKTLYGLLDKRAVAVGGGLTHRLSLHDAPMFKSTHLKLLNFDWEKLVECFAHLPPDIPFATVEVTDLSQAREILEILEQWEQGAGKKNRPIFFLFDNFSSDELVADLAELSKPKNVFFEASGGITLENVRKYAKTGVDVVSVGALTHSAKALDFSLWLAK